MTRIAVIVAGILSAMCPANVVMAQEAGGSGGNVVVTQSFPWGGLFLTIVMAGLCLFAICRSSRRN